MITAVFCSALAFVVVNVGIANQFRSVPQMVCDDDGLRNRPRLVDDSNYKILIAEGNDSSVDFRIVGGQTVRMIEYPYQAELQRYGKHHCGGSIISQEYILTAAHCLQYFPDAIQVRVGSRYVTKGGQFLEVTERYYHPQYNSFISDYDIGVVKVSPKIKINNKTTKIVKLADSGSSLTPGDFVSISGWGQTKEHGPYSKVLKAVDVPVLPPLTCKSSYMYTGLSFTDRMFCAGFPDGGKDACVGDSGGPVVHNETLVQYGVVSWSIGCARKEYPGVNTLIPAPVIRDWITEVTGL